RIAPGRRPSKRASTAPTTRSSTGPGCLSNVSGALRAVLLTACLYALVVTTTSGAMLLPLRGDGAVPPGAAAGSSDTTFVITGAGNGHGVGLSQYGALAQARAGRSAADILAFYFPGTQPAHKSFRKLRVLVAPAAKSITISSAAPYVVKDGLGGQHQLDAGAVTFGPELQVAVGGVPTTLTGPLTFAPGTGALISVGGHPY